MADGHGRDSTYNLALVDNSVKAACFMVNARTNTTSVHARDLGKERDVFSQEESSISSRQTGYLLKCGSHKQQMRWTCHQMMLQIATCLAKLKSISNDRSRKYASSPDWSDGTRSASLLVVVPQQSETLQTKIGRSDVIWVYPPMRSSTFHFGKDRMTKMSSSARLPL